MTLTFLQTIVQRLRAKRDALDARIQWLEQQIATMPESQR